MRPICHARQTVVLLLASTLFFRVDAQEIVHWHLVHNLNVANGLPQNTIRSMHFDPSNGFLWLATEGGLVRYDGVDTKAYTIQNVPTLKSSRIYGIYTTPEGTVLAADRGGSVLQIRQNEAVPCPSLHLEWLNIRDKPVRNLQSLAGEKANMSGRIADATPDFDDLLWIDDSLCLTSSRSHIYLFRGTRLDTAWDKPVPGNSTFLADGHSICILNEWGPGYVVNPQQRTLKPVHYDPVLFKTGSPQIFAAGGNAPLLFRNGEIYRIRFDGQAIYADSLAWLPSCPDQVTSMHYDSTNQQLFCGTLSKGLYIYKKTAFYTYQFDRSHGSPGPWTPAELNSIYATALLNDSLLLTDKAVINLHSLNYSLFPAQLFNLWLAIDGGRIFAWERQNRGDGILTQYSVRSLRVEKRFPAIRRPRCIFADRRKQVWLAGDGYLDKLVDDSFVPVLSFNSFQPADTATGFQYLFESPGGTLYGATGSALFLIEMVHKESHAIFRTARNEIRMPYIDKDSLCWIPTYGDGIYLLDLKTNMVYKPAVGCMTGIAYSHCLIEDGSGNFLISTNNGLIRVNRESLIANCRNPKTPLVYQYFDVTNSLMTNEFNGGCIPAYNELPDGTIILPSLNGLVRVAPGLVQSPAAYPLYIESIATTDSEYSYQSHQAYRLNERTLTFALNFGQWDNSARSGIFYRLDDAGDWTYLPPEERKIRVAGLGGGAHRLEIRRQFDLAGLAVSSVVADFTIGKTLFERRIIQVLAGLCFLAVIWLIARLVNWQLTIRNRSLEKKVREKTAEVVAMNQFQRRLMGLMTHDIIVPVRFIARISCRLITDKERLTADSSAEALSLINTTSSGLAYMAENIVHWIRLQEDSYELIASRFDMKDMVTELLTLHVQLAHEKGNRIVLESPYPLSCMHDKSVVRAIVHNLLLNANKFTADGVVTIGYSKEDVVRITVADTGTGIPRERLDRLNRMQAVGSKNGTGQETGWGLGYRLIIYMLRLCNGSMRIDSIVGEGTTVTIVLPECPRPVELCQTTYTEPIK